MTYACGETQLQSIARAESCVLSPKYLYLMREWRTASQVLNSLCVMMEDEKEERGWMGYGESQCVCIPGG